MEQTVESDWTTSEFIHRLTSDINLPVATQNILASSHPTNNSNQPVEVTSNESYEPLDYFCNIHAPQLLQQGSSDDVTTPETSAADPTVLESQSLDDNRSSTDRQQTLYLQQQQQQQQIPITQKIQTVPSTQIDTLTTSLPRMNTTSHYNNESTNTSYALAVLLQPNFAVSTNVNRFYEPSFLSSTTMDPSQTQMYTQTEHIDSSAWLESQSLPRSYYSQFLPPLHYECPVQFQYRYQNQQLHSEFPESHAQPLFPVDMSLSDSALSSILHQTSPYLPRSLNPSFLMAISEKANPVLYNGYVQDLDSNCYYPPSNHTFDTNPIDFQTQPHEFFGHETLDAHPHLSDPSSPGKQRHPGRPLGVLQKLSKVLRCEKRARAPHSAVKKGRSSVYTTYRHSGSDHALIGSSSSSHQRPLLSSWTSTTSSSSFPQLKRFKSLNDKKVTDSAHYRPRNAFFMFRGFFSKLQSSIAGTTCSKSSLTPNNVQTKVSVDCGNLWRSSCLRSKTRCSNCANCCMRTLFELSSSYLKHRQILIQEVIAFPLDEEDVELTTIISPDEAVTKREREQVGGGGCEMRRRKVREGLAEWPLEKSFDWESFQELYPKSCLFRWHYDQTQARAGQSDGAGSESQDLEGMKRIWIENELAYEKVFIEGAKKRLALEGRIKAQAATHQTDSEKNK